jgi:S1-C subfamily serine protease
MFDYDGRVVGIVSAILSRSGGSQGIGFAVSANTARAVVLGRRSLWSGVAATVLDEGLASLLNVPPPYLGMLIEEVAAGSPGDHMKLRGGNHLLETGEDELIVGGDVLLEIQGVPLDGIDNFVRAREVFRTLADGDTIRLKVLRGGEVVDLTSLFVEDLLVPPPAEPGS